MNPTIKILSLVAVLLLAATTVTAQTTADATANILVAFGCENTAGDAGDLDWGDIVPGTTVSEVYITPDAAGTRSILSGDATLVGTDNGNSAEFTVTGVPDAIVDISITSQTINLYNAAADETMNTFLQISSTVFSSGLTLTGGTATFYVGGYVNVQAAQSAGAYTGTFEVTAAYQ